jgi:hypothetical protein
MKTLLYPLFAFLFILLSSACTRTDDEAQAVVDNALDKHGSRQLENAQLSFDFRGRHYTYSRQGDEYRYTREFSDSTGQQVQDVLSNGGFTRYVNGQEVQLPEERQRAFSNSVNSVIYFALLPWGLNDPAVKKEWVGSTDIEGTPYRLVNVSFEEEGGGEDHEDQFLYWFNTQTQTMDYLAYSYKTEGGGVRFRKAINPREVEGILFQDYINYKPASDTASLEALEELYEKGELEVLSEIRLENIEVVR